MSNAKDFISGAAKFGGTGSDGAFAPGASYDFSDAEGSWVVKEYSSITINSGEVISATNRIKGLILYCSGDVVINGEIDLDGKGYGSEQAPPMLYDRYYSGSTLKSAWAEYCSGVRGGDGGGGGGAGMTAGTVSGGNGAHAGGSGSFYLGLIAYTAGGNASGWVAGRAVDCSTQSGQPYSGAVTTVGGAIDTAPFYTFDQSASTASKTVQGGGGCGFLGTGNAGGNSGLGAVGTTPGENAALTTGTKYGGALLVIIAKGTITLGSTANLHSQGETASDLSSDNGCDGGAGGGCIVLLSEGAQSIDGSATRTVTGGTSATNSGYGGDGGAGDAGTLVEQVVA